MDEIAKDRISAGRVLVCGSIALDLLGRYDGSFGEYQSRYSVKSLNISLPLASLRTTFGGYVELLRDLRCKALFRLRFGLCLALRL